MNLRRKYLTLEYGGQCQTTAGSCVVISVAVSKEVALEACVCHSLGNQKGRVGQRRKSAVGATEDLDTDKMPTFRDSCGATQPGVCPLCCFFCHSNLIKTISGRNVLRTGVSSALKISSEWLFNRCQRAGGRNIPDPSVHSNFTPA